MNWRKEEEGGMTAFWPLAGSKECTNALFCRYGCLGSTLNIQLQPVLGERQRNGSDI